MYRKSRVILIKEKICFPFFLNKNTNKKFLLFLTLLFSFFQKYKIKYKKYNKKIRKDLCLLLNKKTSRKTLLYYYYQYHYFLFYFIIIVITIYFIYLLFAKVPKTFLFLFLLFNYEFLFLNINSCFHFLFLYFLRYGNIRFL